MFNLSTSIIGLISRDKGNKFKFITYFINTMTLAKIGIESSIRNGGKFVVRRSSDSSSKVYLNCYSLATFIKQIAKKIKKSEDKNIYIISNFNDSVYLRVMIIHAIGKLLRINGLTINILLRQNTPEVLAAIKTYLYAFDYPNNINIVYHSGLKDLKFNVLCGAGVTKTRAMTDDMLNKFVMFNSNIDPDLKNLLTNALNKLFKNADAIYDDKQDIFVDNASKINTEVTPLIRQIITYCEKERSTCKDEFKNIRYASDTFISTNTFNYIA